MSLFPVLSSTLQTHIYAQIPTGCIAALEAEKYLSEMEAEVDNPLEKGRETEESKNSVMPEYRSNQLL